MKPIRNTIRGYVDLRTTANINGSLIACCLEQQAITKLWIEWVVEAETD
jgi:hypothetical protein